MDSLLCVDRPVVSPAHPALHAGGVRRVVVHDHSSGARQVRHGLRGLAKRLATRLPWVAADAVVAVSEYVAERQRTAGRVPAGRTQAVPNPVSIPETIRPAAEVRASLGLSPGRRLVAAAGRLTPEKGFGDLIAAAEALPPDAMRSSPRPASECARPRSPGTTGGGRDPRSQGEQLTPVQELLGAQRLIDGSVNPGGDPPWTGMTS